MGSEMCIRDRSTPSAKASRPWPDRSVLASAPPPPPLVCTIQTVEKRWSGQPISGIRQLEQQFMVVQSDNPGIEPETVIDSRLTSLVEHFSSSGVEQMEGFRLTYHWSYETSLGALTFNAPEPPAELPRRVVSLSAEIWSLIPKRDSNSASNPG